MHKKSRLEERLANCADIAVFADLKDKNMAHAAGVKEYLNFFEIFGNSNPVHLEIGCGKGKFVCETAQMHPEINFLACEKISNVLIEAMERVHDLKLKNVYFLNCACEVLPKYIPDGAIEKIYLNFSNPLPKEGYKKQRLTHPRFLKLYSAMLVCGGEIVQKTDDESFFDFSLASFKESGFKIVDEVRGYITAPDDVETEHEKKFKDLGKRIYRLVAKNLCLRANLFGDSGN